MTEKKIKLNTMADIKRLEQEGYEGYVEKVGNEYYFCVTGKKAVARA